MMNAFRKIRLLIIIFLIPSSCLDVTPHGDTVELVAGETANFTAATEIDDATLVWTLDGVEVGIGEKYSYVSDNPGTEKMVHRLTVSERADRKLWFPETWSWDITVLPDHHSG